MSLIPSVRSSALVAVVSLVAVTLLLTAPLTAEEDPAVAEIRALIEECYVHGAFNELDPEAMVRGFHEDFAIFSPKGEEIRKYPIAAWSERTAERKADPEFDPADNRWQHHFASIDVTGQAASVKIELSKDGKLVYTDYLSLLRFDSGWRIVGKVYHGHE